LFQLVFISCAIQRAHHQHSLLRSSPDTGLINPIPQIPLTRTTKISEPTIFIYHLNTPNTFLHRAPLQHHLPKTISGIASASSALSHRFYPTVPELPYSCARPPFSQPRNPNPRPHFSIRTQQHAIVVCNLCSDRHACSKHTLRPHRATTLSAQSNPPYYLIRCLITDSRLLPLPIHLPPWESKNPHCPFHSGDSLPPGCPPRPLLQAKEGRTLQRSV
jgi:hypothetical protein